MLRVVLLSLLTLGVALAQAQFLLIRVPPSLVSYLELTYSQQQQIVQASDSFNTFTAGKQQRSIQVQAELNQEMQKPDPDALALGMRYRELEAIRRETEAERTRAVQTTQAILTVAQKQNLAVLQEALRLQSTACDAVNWNLILPPVLFSGRNLIPGVQTGGFISVLVPSSGTCGTLTFRSGDFTVPLLP